MQFFVHLNLVYTTDSDTETEEDAKRAAVEYFIEHLQRHQHGQSTVTLHVEAEV